MLTDGKLDNYIYYSPDVGTSRIKDDTPSEIIEEIKKYDALYFSMMGIHYVYNFHVPGDGDKDEEFYKGRLKKWRAEHGDELPGKEWQE